MTLHGIRDVESGTPERVLLLSIDRGQAGGWEGYDLGYVTLTQLSESQGTGQIFTLLEQFPQC